ncbi:hypothetical protein Tco_0021280, partial [Tanacetum coccineum]
SPNYSPAFDSESDDPSSNHIPPLPSISPFLSSADDTTNSDTLDIPPSPTHAPGQPIPHGRPYRYHLNGPVYMMTARKRVGPLPSQQLAVRRRSPMTSIPTLPPVSKALSLIHVDLIPSPKRVMDSVYLSDVEVYPRETSLRDDVIGIDARVVVEAVDREACEMGAKGPVEVKVERVTHPAMPEDIPELAQEGAVEVTYETLGDLVQRFHDHTEAILVHHIQVIEGVQREQGHRIVGVESAVTALTKRIAELKRDNGRLRGSASVESQRVDRLQRDMSRMQRELRQIRRIDQ